jgi:hypothetical protein
VLTACLRSSQEVLMGKITAMRAALEEGRELAAKLTSVAVAQVSGPCRAGVR